MKRYWQFLIVGVICLLVALLWAQPPRPQSAAPGRGDAIAAAQQGASGAPPASHTASAKSTPDSGQAPLPGSSSSLPLLAVIGFGVLAGGITSAMRTR